MRQGKAVPAYRAPACASEPPANTRIPNIAITRIHDSSLQRSLHYIVYRCHRNTGPLAMPVVESQQLSTTMHTLGYDHNMGRYSFTFPDFTRCDSTHGVLVFTQIPESVNWVQGCTPLELTLTCLIKPTRCPRLTQCLSHLCSCSRMPSQLSMLCTRGRYLVSTRIDIEVMQELVLALA